MAFDKPTAKALATAAGLATPPSVTLPRETFHDLGAAAVIDLIVARLGLPLYVKPSRGGSALGAGAVSTAAELPAAVLSCFAYGDTALIERFVTGTEVAIGVIDLGQGPQALPAVEIVPGEGAYDYAARYTAGKTEFYVPARLPAAVAEEAARVAIAAHTVLGLRDLSRPDRDQHAATGPGGIGPPVRPYLRPPARAGRRPRRLRPLSPPRLGPVNEELRAELLRRVAVDQEARRTVDTEAMAAADGENLP